MPSHTAAPRSVVDEAHPAEGVRAAEFPIVKQLADSGFNALFPVRRLVGGIEIPQLRLSLAGGCDGQVDIVQIHIEVFRVIERKRLVGRAYLSEVNGIDREGVPSPADGFKQRIVYLSLLDGELIVM